MKSVFVSGGLEILFGNQRRHAVDVTVDKAKVVLSLSPSPNVKFLVDGAGCDAMGEEGAIDGQR